LKIDALLVGHQLARSPIARRIHGGVSDSDNRHSHEGVQDHGCRGRVQQPQLFIRQSRRIGPDIFEMEHV
jgi:hypothetical protein